MPTQREIDALRSVLGDLTQLSAADLAVLWQEIDGASPSQIEDILVQTYPALITPYLAAAAEVATVWYDDLAPTADFRAAPTAPPPVEQMEASARWAVGPLFGRGDAAVLSLLAGSAQRYVFGGARDTVITNAAREGTRWARHASANACAFCRLLATRGAAYNSRQTAMQAHDHCRCMAVPVRPGDTYKPAPYISQWEKEYNTARSKSDGSTDGILTVMRLSDPTT